MTVKQLIERLKECNQNMEVMYLSSIDNSIVLKSPDNVEEIETDKKAKYVLISCGLDDLEKEQNEN